ncbi:1-acyl-sn-glycerol-3-phosphate acyltransferase [Luteolibacter luteus]|uniref:1-acyl-sn-glycerol-3-phosphate acyltransferase n=1 Tax=Luteolibacter luteus TaxID=2728835 RepID=A0A858RL93_9BACT|nr:1-acyl-sn-glycerol-3-phosphate acyltransferase [Luteolibacter luteus]QJE98116.1 1-acyl-sn-glycerol-3-phosphate acyltransferase [Luteolibacter luteus]
MRRLRNDLPYTFRPPKPRGWFRRLGLWANDLYLRRKFGVSRLDDQGFEKVRELSRAGHAILLAPNHADHSDPHVMVSLVAKQGMHSHFMAAREVFEVSKTASWALESMGVFSVDRDGPDLSAIKTAISLLEKTSDPLVIYPEGEIYHHHERLDPLHEGVASILLKAAGRLENGKEAYLVPVGIRFRHDPEVEETFSDRLSKLEDRIGWTPKPSMPVDDRILRLGTGLLGLKEMEYLGEAGRGNIQDRLATICESLLSEVESRLGKDAKSLSAPERVRALRYRIRRRLLDAERPPTFIERDGLLDDLDRAFTALQAHSYIGDYFLAERTLDRRAETIMKLEEDLLGFPNYPTPRTARVNAGEPIPVSKMLAAGELPAKGGAGELTRLLEAKLASLLVAS